MCNRIATPARQRADTQRRSGSFVGTAALGLAMLPVGMRSLLPSAALAQTTTATLSGNVVDDTGAILPEADVVLRQHRQRQRSQYQE